MDNLRLNEWPKTGVSHNETFDFIVVGAGSAGSAVTGRLVEAGHKVSQYSNFYHILHFRGGRIL